MVGRGENGWDENGKEEGRGKDGESGRGRGMLGGREGMKKGEGRDGRTPKISKRGCA